MPALGLCIRAGAGAGYHDKGRKGSRKRAQQVPRKRKHKGRLDGGSFSSGCLLLALTVPPPGVFI